MILRDMQQRCPGLTTDLLVPQPPDWMRQDVLAYEAIQRGRLAGAKAVHLQATKLSPAVVSAVRAHGFDIHVWDVNDDRHLLTCSTWASGASVPITSRRSSTLHAG